MGTESLPPPIRPMLATLGDMPAPPGWGYEFKWDGVRAVVAVGAGGLRVSSRNDNDVTTSYPELGALIPRFRRPVLLDGEIVALDERDAPSFALLQLRMHVRRPSVSLLERVPVRLYVFDLLYRAGEPTLGLPYASRRDLLADLDLGGIAATPPYWVDGGDDLMRAAAENGLEGVVAKRLDSTYQPGQRTRLWIKTPINTNVEVVIGGWKPGAGRRAGMIGSLLLGRYRGDRLRYVGKVGTGFTDRMLRDLASRLAPLRRETSPFDQEVPREDARDAQWTEPRLVGEVTYRTVSPDGRLRHPAWRGLRPDRDPEEIQL